MENRHDILQNRIALDPKLLSNDTEQSRISEQGSYTVAPVVNFAKLIKATPFQVYPSTPVISIANIQPTTKSPLTRYQFEPDRSVSDGINEESQIETSFDTSFSRDKMSCSGDFSQGILKTGRRSRFSVEGRRSSVRRKSSGSPRIRIVEPNEARGKSLFYKCK